MCRSTSCSCNWKAFFLLVLGWPTVLPAHAADKNPVISMNVTGQAEISKEIPISQRKAPYPDIIGVWQRWEQCLISSGPYTNPCTDLKVQVRFEGPDGRTRQGLGCWDGDRRFLIRGVFPAPGQWRWSTTCSNTEDSGLHGQSGTVEVKPVSNDNPLTQHGFLKVSDDGRLLVYDDGTPFLWIGDTCWAAPVHADMKEWKQYVANRVAKGYSVLQLSIAPEWALKHSRLGIPPFLSTLPDITKPNPRFFKEMDKKLAYANDHGLVVMMVGLMETPYECPPLEQIAVFSQYIAARYNSFAVIFSPSFDAKIQEPQMLASANAVHQAAPASLITMHMGTGVGPHFHAADWLSFDMYQSGHNGGDAARQSARAVGMAAEVLSLSPRKPLINGETIYEGDLGAAFDVRRTGWLSILSGAVGYTAGINELYLWEQDALAKMNLPSSDQVALMARILRAIPWWQLEPEPKRILNQPKDRARLMALAITADKELGMAYLPANEAIEMDLSQCLPAYDVLWINPASGRWHDGTRIDTSPKTALAAPDNKDWGVVLAAPRSQAITQLKETLARVPSPQPKTTASITFAADAACDGLVHKEPADGVFVPRTVNGVDCIVNQNPKRNTYLYIDVDDRLAFRNGPARMTVEIRIQSDDPLEGIRLQYDAQGTPGTGDSRYKPVSPSSRKQEDGWTVIAFEADAPYLGNRQNSGADFRVFLDHRLCRIAALHVELK